jgi:ribosomal protein S18 acetylase RimI-like enzyme
MSTNKLDNPVWYSLEENHQAYCVDFGNVRYYDPTYAPFGAFLGDVDIINGMHEYSLKTDDFFVVGDKPLYPDILDLKKELVCDQMVLENAIPELDPLDITEISEDKHSALRQLVEMVQPGYFCENTALLGTYFGIHINGELVAVTGERMKMNDYTEISAVVTHPAHAGKGFAKRLITHTAAKIFSENKIPFLHVAETNSHAIALYEKLGFSLRRKISFWNFARRAELPE